MSRRLKMFYVAYTHSSGQGVRRVRAFDATGACYIAAGRVERAGRHTDAKDFRIVSKAVGHRIFNEGGAA